MAILTDTVPKARAGVELLPEVERRLGDGGVTRVVLEGAHGRVHADEATVARAVAGCAGAACIVTVGSGTLADIGKATSARLGGVPHVVVQTATSVNGFADDQSVLVIEGVKRTTPTRWPDALIADADVLAGAPVALNVGGVGDLVAMFTAPADWRLAHLLGMADAYSAEAVALARAHGAELLELAPRVRDADPEALTALAGILALSGIAMGVAHTTAPASGMEHTVSHLIEMAMNSRGQDSAFHGAQVGVSTVVAAVVWKRMAERLRHGVDLTFPSGDEMAGRVRAAFASLDPSGAMGEECWRLYSRKLESWTATHAALGSTDWSAVIAGVTPLLGEPGAIAHALGATGAATRFSELDPPVTGDLARWALASCHLMRDRFTVADLAFLSGAWSEDDVDAALTEAASVGGGL